MKISKEVKVGLVVVISLGLFYYGYNYLKGSKLFKAGSFIYAEYNNINGLEIDNPVLVKGFRVGKVNDLVYNPETEKVSVEIYLLNDDIQIPKNSEAIIVNSSLIGGKEIQVKMGDSSEYLESGDMILSGTEDDIFSSLTSSLEPFEKGALQAVQSIDSVMKLLQVLLNEENRTIINKGLRDLEGTLDNLNEASGDLNSLVTEERAKIKEIIANLNSMSANLNAFSDTLADLEIKKTIDEANGALKSANAILKRVDEGEGSLGQLVNNDTLYINLENAAKNLEILLKDMEENPKRYVQFSVFGGKEKDKKKE